ncbi:MaoC family dehydratase [Pantoea sp. Ap-967]|uniref:MaoC family dehydratase n=1 Tax=Pantoea sp. Ap-967 TaxID=2608362 RepID=UPI0014224133|nr:MaoC family dehydratase [Pantoea sp. Ap-967]NIE72955.1 MaoC family dehydratase [Pantoea sp. Ap-967]
MPHHQIVARGIPLECLSTSPILSIADLESNIGVELSCPSFLIDPDEAARFSRSTYLDQAYPESEFDSPYKDGLIEGFYLISLMDALKKCTFRDASDYYGLNYGSNRLRFIEPIYLNDLLTFTCSVTSIQSKAQGFLVELRCQLKKHGTDRPAVDYSMIYFLLPAGTELEED